MSRHFVLASLLLVFLLGPLICEAAKPGSAKPPRLDRLSEEQGTAVLAPREGERFEERLTRISGLALGIPYKNDPLGEGSQGLVDHDPTFRLDRFDCLTFVETVWALARSHTIAEAQSILQTIRYAEGTIRYSKRNHFAWAQWIVNNRKAGLVKVVSRDVAGEKTRVETKVYKPIKRYSSRWKALLSSIDGYPFPATTQEVVPLDLAIREVKAFPTPCLLFIVTKEQAWTPVRIRHVGLVVTEKGKPMLRHASRHHGRVVDVSLSGYLRHAKKAEKAPVVGVIPVRFQLPEK